MALPKDPRQLMINLMYLVLTALLAMNVSREVINAFNIVDDSIVNSNEKIDVKNAATIVNFEEVLENNDGKLTPEKKLKIQNAKDIADQARTLTATMVNQLAGYRNELVEAADGIDTLTGRIAREDDLEAPTRVMIEEKKGVQMFNALNKYKKDIAKLVNDLENANLKPNQKATDIEPSLPIDFKLKGVPTTDADAWAFGNFNMVPAVASTTIVDKYINDVKNSESMALDKLWANAMGEKKQKKITFTDFDVLLSANSSYILPGEKYTAQVMLGAYSKKGQERLSITVNGRNLPIRNGIADFSTVASSKPGPQKLTVSASYYDNDEGIMKRVGPKTYEYYVGQPQATISVDKMNVFYKGLPNPITVSASGIVGKPILGLGPNIKLTEDPSGPGKYFVTVSAYGKTTISLKGKRGDGGIQDFGTREFRLKRIPDPVPEIGRKTSGDLSISEMQQQIAIIAKLKDFVYDTKFKVTSYGMVYIPKRGDPNVVTSNNGYLDSRAPGQVRDILNKLKVGDRLIFENIRALGPDGETRKLPSLSYSFPN